MRRGVLSATAAAVLLVSASALAASDTGTYKGKTGQHFAFTLKLYKKNSYFYADAMTKLKYKCSSGSLTQAEGFENNIVKHHGNRYSLTIEGGNSSYSELIKWSWTINGKALSGSVTSTVQKANNKCHSGTVGLSATR